MFKKVPRKPVVFDSYFFSLLSSTFPHLPRTAKFDTAEPSSFPARVTSLVNHST